MNARQPARALRATVLLLAGTLLAGTVQAGPVAGLRTQMTRPDGTAVDVRVWGDEYHQHVENLAGYTLVRDARDGRICYAELAADGRRLVSTGVSSTAAPPERLQPGIALPGDVVMARREAAREAAGQPRRGSDKLDYPLPATHGEVRGIAVLVDFSDDAATIDPAEIDAFLNQPGYDRFGNNGSVRDYYHDVSGAQLDLTHEVSTYYYRAAHPKSWYEDPSQSPGYRARQLVTEALEDLDRRGFDFSSHDANGDGYVDLVSLFYAGVPEWSFSSGLWPQSGDFGFHADGVMARIWQVSNLGDTLRIGIPVHEIGHALCQWPDLYDYGGESFGIGQFCVMSDPTDLLNPVQPSGPLKLAAEWAEVELLDGVMDEVAAPADGSLVYALYHPWVDTELYVVESRQQAGRDAALPDAGLAIWHVDWRGSNNREARLPDIHYMVTLVQADGNWDLENRRNRGDDTDLFKAPLATEFDPQTDPPARWWRLSHADLHITDIGAPGDTVRFSFHDGVGVHPIELVNEPPGLEAPWRITGAGGYVKSGTGTHTAYVPETGSYVVTWLDVPGWQAAPSSTVLVTGDEPRPEVSGLYTHPPFSATEVPALVETDRGLGGLAADHDDDGDLDLFIHRRDAGDLLLRNEGGWQFTDITPDLLRTETTSLAAQWADVDADGDRDLFVVREEGQTVLLRQAAGGGFAAAEALPPDVGDVRAAVWIDYDGDGRLDLHLVRDGQPDLLLNAPDKNAPRLDEFAALAILPGQGFARRQGAAWCDYDGDGRLDLYSVTLYGQNLLVNNQLPDAFANATHGGLGLPWRAGAAAWGDYDNDGDFDLYYAQDGALDVLFTQYGGTFVMESSTRVNTPGNGKDVAWADFDNDGHLDLYLARAGQPDRLLLGDGERHWDEAPLLIPDVGGMSMAVVAADLDGDGGVDLTVVRDDGPALLLHNTMSRGNWLQVEVESAGSLGEPVGAVVTVHTGSESRVRQVDARSGPSVVSRRVHFGLGATTAVDSLVIEWPDGAVQVERDVAVNQLLDVRREGAGPDHDLPGVTRLDRPYPNPFNPAVNLAVDMARAGPARLEVFDVRGRLVTTLHEGPLDPGRHLFRWEGRGSGRAVAAGVYLVRFTADGAHQYERMTLVR